MTGSCGETPSGTDFLLSAAHSNPSATTCYHQVRETRTVGPFQVPRQLVVFRYLPNAAFVSTPNIGQAYLASGRISVR